MFACLSQFYGALRKINFETIDAVALKTNISTAERYANKTDRFTS